MLKSPNYQNKIIDGGREQGKEGGRGREREKKIDERERE